MKEKISFGSKRKILTVYIALIIVTLAAYWQVNEFEFVNIDDPVYIIENYHIHSGISLEGLRWAFSIQHAAFWHPLTWLFLMFDYQIYGLDAGGFHLTNLILHVLSTLLLFCLFHRMTQTIWKSAFVAAFFALHPLHVESVAWVTERKDVLSAFFWMLTLYLYVYYTEKPVIKRYLLVLLCFILGLMSKSMLVTLPVIMIFLDYWPLKRFQLHKGNLILWQLQEKIFFFILSAIFSIITLNAQKGLSIDYPITPLNLRILNALISFVCYIKKLFLPHDMTFFYPFLNRYPLGQILGYALIIIIISILVIIMIKRLPYLFTGWMWYTISIAPVIGIIQFSSQAMADRYIYIPSIGISIMLAWGVPMLFKKENMRRKILFPTTVALLIIFSFLTWKQCGYWKNSIELLNHALHIRKDVYIVHDCLGVALFAEGKNKEAIDHFNQAILLHPEYHNAYYNRGSVYLESGQYQKAIQDFSEAIRI
ncbi:MAG: tetratricopeptide repeat protein, partial [Syntrophaceae bacterium]|nr:tetratricopeptide repeat protein [Syntrophaceae bacterium]